MRYKVRLLQLRKLNLSKSLFILCFLCLSCPLLLRGQGTVLLKENFSNIPLAEALKQIEKKYNYYVSFDVEKVKGISLDKKIENLSIHQALELMLAGTGLTYEIVEQQFIVIKTAVAKKKQSENLQIRGVILDAETKEQLPFALVKSQTYSKGVVADKKGQFSFEASLTDTLVFSFLGYKNYQIAVNQIQKDKSISISLNKSVKQLGQVDVAARNDSLKLYLTSKNAGRQNMTNALVANLPAANDNLMYALQFLPGVDNGGGFSSDFEVRGGTTDQNLVLVDGFPVYQIEHYYGLQNAINPVITDSVTLMKGGFDSKYGLRLSSIMDVKLEQPKLSKVEGEVGVLSSGFEGYISVPIVKNKLAIMVAARKSHNYINGRLIDGHNTGVNYEYEEEGYDEGGYEEEEDDDDDNDRYGLHNTRVLNGGGNPPNNGGGNPPNNGGGNPPNNGGGNPPNNGGDNPPPNNGGDNPPPPPVSVYQNTVRPVVSFYDLNLKLGYQVNSRNSITVSSLLTEDSYVSEYDIAKTFKRKGGKIEQELANVEDARQWINRGLSLHWQGNYTNWESNFIVAGSQFEWNHLLRESKIKPHNENKGDAPPLSEREENHTIRDISVRFENRIKTGFGEFDLGAFYNDYLLGRRIKPKPDVAPNEVKDWNLTGGFAQWNKKFGRLETKLGGRLWSYSFDNELYFAPRLSLYYPLLDDFVGLKFATGRYYQFMHRVVDPLSARKHWLGSNKNQIPILFSDHFVGGLTLGKKKGKGKFDAEVYLKTTEGDYTLVSDSRPKPPNQPNKPSNPKPSPSPPDEPEDKYEDEDSEYTPENLVNGEGVTYGLDAFYEWQSKNWQYYIAYSYNDYELNYSSSRSDYKQTNMLQLAVMYHTDRVKIGATWQWRRIKRDYIGLEEAYDDDEIRIYQLLSNMPDYHRLDLSAQYNFKIGNRLKAELALVIYDVYDRKNVQAVELHEISNESDLLESDGEEIDATTLQSGSVVSDISQIGLLPTLSFKVRF